MNISDPLNPSKFAADCEDILITDTDQSRTFTLLKGGTPIMSETYNYDADGNIRITGLADVLMQSLYGELKEGEQSHATDTFEFQIDGVTQFRKNVCSMRLRNVKDPEGEKLVLVAGTNGVCYAGVPHLMTVIGSVPARICIPGSTISQTSIGESGKVMTVDCDPKKLFPSHYNLGTYMVVGEEITRTVLHQACDDAVTVRFLNRYDMPECVTAAYWTEKPAVSDDTALMYGRKTRFSVKSATDYTLHSGPMRSERQFDTWQDLLTSRRAQLLWRDQWIDIVISKSNYTRQRRQMYGSQAEISFQTANPLMTI